MGKKEAQDFLHSMGTTYHTVLATLVPLTPDAQQILDDNLWDLYDGETMTNDEYAELASRTDLEDYAPVKPRASDGDTLRILHAGIGLSTEAGEILDALKKHLFYGKTLDTVNLKEEVGDVLWYLALMCDALCIDFEDAMKMNIAKLSSRYGDKFSADKALIRDLDAERKILEQHS